MSEELALLDRTELALLEAVYKAARDVRDEWRIRGDHMVERKIEGRLQRAIGELDDWRGTA